MRLCLKSAGLAVSMLFTLPTMAQDEGDAAAPAETPADTAASGPTFTFKPYVGFDYVSGKVTNLRAVNSSTTDNDFDFSMLRARGGVRLFEMIGLELQFGTGANTEEAELDRYLAILAVPTTTVFDFAEIAFPVGIARTVIEQGGTKFDNSDVTYGFQSELPLRNFADLPDVRVTLGYQVYHSGSRSQTYGFNLGVRYDFDPVEGNFARPTEALSSLFSFGD